MPRSGAAAAAATAWWLRSALLLLALLACVFAEIGHNTRVSTNERRQRFEELTTASRDRIGVGDLSGAQYALSEALKLKPSSTKTANDLAVVFLQQATDEIDRGLPPKVGNKWIEMPSCLHLSLIHI